jgi:hypothetical protein
MHDLERIDMDLYSFYLFILVSILLDYHIIRMYQKTLKYNKKETALHMIYKAVEMIEGL